MKFRYRICMASLSALVMLASCSNNDEPFSVAGPEDEPHILAPTFPDRSNNGELPVVANISRDANFSMQLTVTPADYVDVVWLIDGNEVATGKSIDMPLLAGTYEMKVVVTTPQGKTTSREGIVKVNPLDADPWSSELSFERIVAPGQHATLYGSNLKEVAAVRIGQSQPISVTYSNDGDAESLGYLVPADASDGTSRLVLLGSDGEEYGANKVTISSSSLVTAGADRFTSNSLCTLSGVNLDKVASLEIGDVTIRDFKEMTPSMLQFVAPALEDGEYAITGKMADGGAVTFYKNNRVVNSTRVVISSQQTLWSGHHYVSWDLADDNPNKTFNQIGMDVFSSIKAGAVLSIHYSVEPAAEYHQLRTTSGWWTDLPGTGTVDFSEDGILEVTLTQSCLDMIQEQGGFLCVGHGYYVDLVTLH